MGPLGNELRNAASFPLRNFRSQFYKLKLQLFYIKVFTHYFKVEQEYLNFIFLSTEL